MKDLMNMDSNNITFEESLNLFIEFSVRSKEATYMPPMIANDRDFGSDFPGGLIQKPRYTDCRFHSSEFMASNGAFSTFNRCHFCDCNIEGANLNYCDFRSCNFISNEKFLVSNTGFNFSQFLNVSFDGIIFEGISFRDILLKGCTFSNCNMKNSTLERAVIRDTKFKDIDFRYIGIRYCQFENVEFENVVFPILDLPNNIGLADIFEKNSNSVRFSLGYHKTVTFEEAKKLLLLLIPFYQETKQYFPILNTYLINNQYEDNNKLFQTAIENSLKECDFDTLYNICKLVSHINLFDKHQQAEFFQLIKSQINPNGFPYNIQKGYIHYMDEIKDILIENPNNLPRADIELITTIPSNKPEELTPIIAEIETIFSEVSPNTSPYIQISHNSPYKILIFFYEHLNEIESICKIVYYSLGAAKLFSELQKYKKSKIVNSNLSSNTYKDKQTETSLVLGPIRFSRKTKEKIKSAEFCISE